LARDEQDAASRISALHTLLARNLSDRSANRNVSAISDLQGRIRDLEAARKAILNEIDDRYPAYGDLIRPRILLVDEVISQLTHRESLILVYTGFRGTFIWGVSSSKDLIFANSKLGTQQLTQVVNTLRNALAPSITKLGDIPEFDVALAYDLFTSIFAPVAEAWSSSETINIVAYGPLQQLPPSLLPTTYPNLGQPSEPLFSRYANVSWLAKSHAIALLPSVASLSALRRASKSTTSSMPFLGFGDPYFSAQQAKEANNFSTATASRSTTDIRGAHLSLRTVPNTRTVTTASLSLLPRLPDTRSEVIAVAKALGANEKTDVFLGKDADEKRIKTMNILPYQVVSIATHGLVEGDLDGLDEPALALSSPAVTGNDEDGLLTMSEVLSLRMNADWTVLSACNTAAAGGKGAEAVSGLGRAFFYAGSKALLVSNWPVHSAATTELMTNLFRMQAENPSISRAEALRQARLLLINGPGYTDKSGQSLFSYAHPIFWAPFTIVGLAG
jgi:CHAT domain-containing protein